MRHRQPSMHQLIWAYSDKDWALLIQRQPEAIPDYLERMARHETLLKERASGPFGGYDWACMGVAQAIVHVFALTGRSDLIRPALIELLRTATMHHPPSESTSFSGGRPVGDVVDTPDSSALKGPSLGEQRWAIVRRAARLALETGTSLVVPDDIQHALRLCAAQEHVAIDSDWVLKYHLLLDESQGVQSPPFHSGLMLPRQDIESVPKDLFGFLQHVHEYVIPGPAITELRSVAGSARHLPNLLADQSQGGQRPIPPTGRIVE